MLKLCECCSFSITKLEYIDQSCSQDHNAKLELVALAASTCLYFHVSKPACVVAKAAFLTVEQYVIILYLHSPPPSNSKKDQKVQLTSIQAGVKLCLTDSSTAENPKTN